MQDFKSSLKKTEKIHENILTPPLRCLLACCYQEHSRHSRHSRDRRVQEVIRASKKPEKLPIILSPEEILHFLEYVGLTNPRAILTSCYAAALRLSEALHLRPATIDSQAWSASIA